MKTKVSKLVKVGYIDGKLFIISINWMWMVRNYLDEVEATLYCDELTDTILDHCYCMDQIFNTDAVRLNSKMLPDFGSKSR